MKKVENRQIITDRNVECVIPGNQTVCIPPGTAGYTKTINMIRLLLTAFLVFVNLSLCAQTPEDNLRKLGIALPEVTEPVGSYVHCVRAGNLLFLAGKGPQKDGQYVKGKLGRELSTEEGFAAARLTGIIQIAVLRKELGSLSKVKRIVKVNGFVNSDSNFYDHPKVINGYSDLMIQVFGEKGKHARTSLGVAALPFNMAVEVEMIVEVE